MIVKSLNELKDFLSTETDNIKICNEEDNEVSFVFKTVYSFSYIELSKICMRNELIKIKTAKIDDYISVKNLIHRGILLNKFYYLGENYCDLIGVYPQNSWSVSTLISSREDSIKGIQEDDLMSQKGKDAQIEKIDKYYSIATEIATYVESDEFKEIFDKEMAEVKIEKVLHIDSHYDTSCNCDRCV